MLFAKENLRTAVTALLAAVRNRFQEDKTGIHFRTMYFSIIGQQETANIEIIRFMKESPK